MRLRIMWIRILTATVLFLMLTQVNLWADIETHLVLAVGYRAFLIAAPLFMFFGLAGGMRTALALCFIGIVGALFAVNSITMVVFALGMAVSGYLVKYISSHTSQGAADNKVSLNVGSLFSGVLLIGMTNRYGILTLAAVLLAVTLYLSFKVDWNQFSELKPAKDSTAEKRFKIELIPLFGWSLIGIATGIKLTGIFTILPQYLIAQLGELPSWFGSLVVLNSIVVIFLQHRVLKVLDRCHPFLTVLLSLSAMILLALPGVLRVENAAFSVAWILLLTLGECALSRYDRIAKEDGFLFPKELMVGVGSLVTVLLSRSFTQEIYWSGLVGVFCLALGAWAITRRLGSV